MLIAIILLFLYIQVCKIEIKKIKDNIETYLQACSFWMLLVFSVTEILSIFNGINKINLMISWMLIDLCLLILLIYQIRKKHITWNLQLIGKSLINNFKENKGTSILYVIGFIVFLLATFTVPYNWDSMTYRLSRVAYWAQNGSVEHYANNSLRLVANPPLGEFIQLHLYVLTNSSDVLFNYCQFFSYITCAVVIYYLAKKLNCNKNFSMLAALLFLSMPIAFAEAINTQVDLIATVWLFVFIYQVTGLIIFEEKITFSKEMIIKVSAMGMSIAWGYLTKPSVCFAMVIFAIWFLIVCIIKKTRIKVLMQLFVVAFISMIIPLSVEIYRNIKTFHAISSPIAGARQLVGTIKPNYLLVNCFKNIVSNLTTPYLSQLPRYLERVLNKIAVILHVELNAESISEDGAIFRLHDLIDYGQDTATNPIIMWLFFICIFIMILQIKKVNWKEKYKSYTMVAIVSFLVFCIGVRWEYYVTRYMLSYFAILCPMIALQLQKGTERKENRFNQNAVFGLVFGLCILEIANMTIYHRYICVSDGANERPSGYFTNRISEYEPCLKITDYIVKSNFETVGLYLGGNDYEYPYWSLLKNDVSRIEHVNVQNESSIYIDYNFVPECIIWIGSIPQENFYWNNQVYTEVQIQEGGSTVHLFVKGVDFAR